MLNWCDPLYRLIAQLPLHRLIINQLLLKVGLCVYANVMFVGCMRCVFVCMFLCVCICILHVFSVPILYIFSVCANGLYLGKQLLRVFYVYKFCARDASCA